MAGSSPEPGSHKRKASDIDSDSVGPVATDDASAAKTGSHPATSTIAPSYSIASQSSVRAQSSSLSDSSSQHSGTPQQQQHQHQHQHQQHQQHQQVQVTGHHGLQSNTGGNKRIKTARACDSCRRKKIRCDVIEDGTAPGDPNNGNGGLTCAHCRQYGFECTFFLPITETRFKKKREREREAELAANAAAARSSWSSAAVLGGPYANLYRSASGTFLPPTGILVPGSSTAGLAPTIARHIPPAPPGTTSTMSLPPITATGRYGFYDSLPPTTPGPIGSRLASQEWPPPPQPPLPSADGAPSGSIPSYRAPWRDTKAPESRSRSYSGPAPRKPSPSQRPDGASGGSSVPQPPDARVLGPTSIAYIVHSHPFVPGAAIEAHDIKHHQTFEVGASGDGIIKFNRPPRRASATSGDDDDPELTAATEVALAAIADASTGPDAKTPSTETLKSTPGGEGIVKPSLADKVVSRQVSTAGSPTVNSGLTRVRLAADVAEKLANVYFSRIANLFPVVTKAEFLHLSPPPPLLLYAVCSIAALSRDVPREVLLCVKTSLSSIFRDSDVLSTSKGVTVRALLVLSLHSDVHGSTAMQSGARCWNRTGCAVRMAQDLGLHRDATGRDDEDDDQFFLEQKRRIWGCCVTADRILSISLGHPLAIDLTDCDVRLPSPYEIKRWAEDPSADPTTDRPFAFNTEMLKLSILFGRVMKTIYSPTGLMKTTDEEISGLLRDIDTWRDMLPPELQFSGVNSGPSAGILHVAFACLQMLFWRVFLRISYICPTHLKFSLNIERMTLLIQWSREAILWVDRNDFYLDTLQLVSYSLVFCATVQYHAWVRRGEKDAREILRTCRDCVNRFQRPGGDEGEDLSMRAKTAGVITMLFEAASGVYANSPCGSQLNPTAGVINRRAVETLRGIVFRADSSRPGGGVYVAADSDHMLQDLPQGTIIHETTSNPTSRGGAGAASAPGLLPNGSADKATSNATWNAVDGSWPSGSAPGVVQQDSSADGDQGLGRYRRASRTFPQFALADGLTSFQIPPEAGMGRAVTAHISENGPIQLELQQPPFGPPQTSSGYGAISGGMAQHSGSTNDARVDITDGNGQQGHTQQQSSDEAPFGINGSADASMAFLQNMNVNPLLNELHWPSQPIMVAGGAELNGGFASSVPVAASSMLANGNDPESLTAASRNGGGGGTGPSNASSGLSSTQGYAFGDGQTMSSMSQAPMTNSTTAGAPLLNGGAVGFGATTLDPSVLDGLPVSGLDFGAWDTFFSRFGQLLPNGDGTSSGVGGLVGSSGGPTSSMTSAVTSGGPTDPNAISTEGFTVGGGSSF